MKKAVALFTFLLTWATAFAQQPFFYKLVLPPAQNTKINKVYVTYEVAGQKYLDSLSLTQKPVTLQRSLPQPVAAVVYTNLKESQPQPVFLANNTLQASFKGSALVLPKAKLQEDFLHLTKNDRLRPTYFPLYGALNAKNDTAGLRKLSILFDSLKTDDVAKAAAYVKENKNSLLALFAFSRLTGSFPDPAQEEAAFALLPAWVKETPEGKSLETRMRGAKETKPGSKAIPFTLTSSTGQDVRLEDFKGKYVLLDFWASWCGPCRKEHPAFTQVYDAYKAKGFEILSVSLDTNQKAWLGAVEKDQMNWTNAVDLKGFSSETALRYGVQAIPANFLIDPTGTIIRANLKGEELSNTLKNLLGK